MSTDYQTPGYVAPEQAVPLELRASPWIRLGAQLLNGLLSIVTLFIGWLIWAMITWSNDSCNPGQKILGLKVVKKDTGAALTWGELFIRNFLLGGIVYGITFSVLYVVDIFKTFGTERQRVLDSMAGTVVIRTK
ncbi:RDD family protein [Streptacidiphilus sp. P02-A3a]|uniref:RDD family protein n=1 Tax=Streptacidiphilus sp. P02-A3a TaxID=2704468 RepID=UPI0015FCFC0D|nr:RDD family protein [Streptacidiphilus sp. P02-A3a]QMU72986.1 RDD family protein [Streptacidiphilus sp. P02-A3a]